MSPRVTGDSRRRRVMPGRSAPIAISAVSMPNAEIKAGANMEPAASPML